MPDKGTMQDHINDLTDEVARLREMLRQKDDTINILSLELKRVNDELARSYE